MTDLHGITVEFALKPGDVYSPFHWGRGNLARWVTAVLLCYIFYDLYTGSSETLRSFAGGSSIQAIVLILFAFVLMGLLLFPFLRVLAFFRGTPNVARTRRVTFRSDIILFESAEAKSECKWTFFSRVIETPRAFIFSQGKAGGTYIPKRCLPSHEDIVLLRALIRENFKGKMVLRQD
jgi:hypothetical protein